MTRAATLTLIAFTALSAAILLAWSYAADVERQRSWEAFTAREARWEALGEE